jgi:hypothetical protein
LLRMNAAEMVGDAGFDVVEAGNADEAIAILEACPDILPKPCRPAQIVATLRELTAAA